MDSVKIRKPAGSFHNTFGVGPQDLSCPPDGVIDNYPAAPDNFLNEEYWGLVSIARNGYNVDKVTPRKVYGDLQKLFAESVPRRFDGDPSGILPSDTDGRSLYLKTDATALCRCETDPGVSFDQMRYTFYELSHNGHFYNVYGLVPGSSYTYYVRCQDSAKYKNEDDYLIHFEVAAEEGIAGKSGK